MEKSFMKLDKIGMNYRPRILLLHEFKKRAQIIFTEC